MRFLDSNILAYAFYDNNFRDSCREAIRKGGMTNTLNLVETFNIIELQTSKEVAIMSIKSLLKSNLKIVDININIVFEALRRAEKYKKLKFIDLVHYTTALMNNCETIVSYDADFDNLELLREKE